MLEFEFSTRGFFDIQKELIIGKKDFFGPSEIKKVDDDGYPQCQQTKKKLWIYEIHAM